MGEGESHQTCRAQSVKGNLKQKIFFVNAGFDGGMGSIALAQLVFGNMFFKELFMCILNVIRFGSQSRCVYTHACHFIPGLQFINSSSLSTYIN